MHKKNEGVCRFCMQRFSERAMPEHLLGCRKKQQQDQKAVKGYEGRELLYLLKVASYEPYWLLLEMKATDTLAHLDRFLRHVWLECCGHPSAFAVKGQRYLQSYALNSLWEPEALSMETSLWNALSLRATFDYDYDADSGSGSITYVSGQVYAQRSGILTEQVRILARNVAPSFPCAACHARATHLCVACDAFHCEKCIKRHACDTEKRLPVVNSPRMGVCAYDGELDFDGFPPPSSNRGGAA